MKKNKIISFKDSQLSKVDFLYTMDSLIKKGLVCQTDNSEEFALTDIGEMVSDSLSNKNRILN